MSQGIELRPLTNSELPAAAAIHCQSFETGWNEAALKEYFSPKGLAIGAFNGGTLLGFILLSTITDQTDIITIAVSPERRGYGIGRQLVAAAEQEAAAQGAELIFLEVAEDNDAAIALYKGAAYRPIGKRKNYYRRANGRVTALTMRKNLGRKNLEPKDLKPKA